MPDPLGDQSSTKSPTLSKEQTIQIERAAKEAQFDTERMKKEVRGWVKIVGEDHEKLREVVRAQRAAIRVEMFQTNEVLREVKKLQARVEELEKEKK